MTDFGKTITVFKLLAARSSRNLSSQCTQPLHFADEETEKRNRGSKSASLNQYFITLLTKWRVDIKPLKDFPTLALKKKSMPYKNMILILCPDHKI